MSRRSSENNSWKINPPKSVESFKERGATCDGRGGIHLVHPNSDLQSFKRNVLKLREFKIGSVRSQNKGFSRHELANKEPLSVNSFELTIKNPDRPLSKTSQLLVNQHKNDKKLERNKYLKKKQAYSERSAKDSSWSNIRSQYPLLSPKSFIFKVEQDPFQGVQSMPEYQVFCKNDMHFKKAIRLKQQQLLIEPLKHENIVPIYGIMTLKQNDYLIVDKCGMKSLSTLTQTYAPPYQQYFVHEKIIELVNALLLLHSRNLIDNRISPSSILINKFGKLSLDCVSTSDKPLREEKKIENFHYISPEYLGTESLTRKNDVWAIGCLALYLSTGELETSPLHPYNQNYARFISVEELKLMRQLRCKYGNMIKSWTIQQEKVQKEEQYQISESTLTFINSCLRINPKHRPELIHLKRNSSFLTFN